MTALNYVTVTGTFKDGSGAPLTGSVTFTPSQPVYAAGVPLVTPGIPVTAEIAGGSLVTTAGSPLALLATDNAGLALEGLTGFWFWEVSVALAGADVSAWQFFLPWSAYGGSPYDGTVDLYVLASTTTPGGGGSGTVTEVSGSPANGFTVSVGDATTTPAVEVGTSVDGLMKGTGTGATAATPGTDYLAPGGSGAALTGITAGQVGADISGAAATAQAAAEAFATGLQPTSGTPLALAKGGTGLSESTAGQLVTALGALLAANDLSDLGSASTARTNLGLGTAAVAALTSLLQAANNLSDLQSASAARTSLGLGTAALLAAAAVLQSASNLSDLANAGTARTNLGLGSAAVQPSSAFDASGAATTAQANAETYAAGLQPTSGSPLGTTVGGTGVSESSLAALLTALLAAGGGTMGAELVPKVFTLTDAATVAVNAALGNEPDLTLGGNRTVGAPSNPGNGQTLRFRVRQPASGGPYTVTWASGSGGYSFGSGSAPTLSTAASACDLVAFDYDSAKNQWMYLGAGTGF